MVVPALIYVAVNAGDAGGAARLGDSRRPPTSPLRSACWRCSATRVPPSLKIFLLALAILDDLGAIVIIALFYTDRACRWISLALAAAGIAVLLGAQPARRHAARALSADRASSSGCAC